MFASSRAVSGVAAPQRQYPAAKVGEEHQKDHVSISQVRIGGWGFLFSFDLHFQLVPATPKHQILQPSVHILEEITRLVIKR